MCNQLNVQLDWHYIYENHANVCNLLMYWFTGKPVQGERVASAKFIRCINKHGWSENAIHFLLFFDNLPQIDVGVMSIQGGFRAYAQTELSCKIVNDCDSRIEAYGNAITMGIELLEDVLRKNHEINQERYDTYIFRDEIQREDNGGGENPHDSARQDRTVEERDADSLLDGKSPKQEQQSEAT